MHKGYPSGPEGYDDGSFIRKYTVYPGTTSYTIFGDDAPIGLTILWINPDSNENILGCIFTDPDTHSRGIGARIRHMIEEAYPDTRVWRTETPLCSTRSMNFYINKYGFMAQDRRRQEPRRGAGAVCEIHGQMGALNRPAYHENRASEHSGARFFHRSFKIIRQKFRVISYRS